MPLDIIRFRSFIMKSFSSGFMLSLCFLLVSASSSTIAATVTGNLGVTAVVGAGCQVNNSNVTSGTVNFGTLDFGSINTLGNANIDAQTTGPGSGSIVMECSNGTTFTITMDNGQHFASGSRSMVNSGNGSMFLAYTLYQNVARTVPWTTGSPLTATANGSPATFNVYGRIPGGQTGVAAGTYNDTVQVVISW